MTATEAVRRLHDDVLAARDHFGNDAAPFTLPPVGPVSQLLLLAGSQLSQAAELLQLAEQLIEATNEEDPS
jgi:hypothetical protein